ncbi:hypothetical protein PQX77_004706 [Marasmius sp. AFHP31]|nr:hypothetical protein PQX77_004706 [Marasmius sp. AFHP31]
MADLLTLDRRTRSHLVLPDSALQLDRSPLKEARTALRNQVEVVEQVVEAEDSDEDPILLSPKKTGNSNKRSLESPQTSLVQINSRFKRLKSEPYPDIPRVDTNGRPSHTRHGSETTVTAAKKPLTKHSAPPSVSKKPSSFGSSENQAGFSPSKPRAMSVPVFPTSLPSFPAIDLRHPPPSPTRSRSRSRSPSKHEPPKLDITILPQSTSLQSIPDEKEPAMDVDIRSPERVQRSVKEQETPIPYESTPKPRRDRPTAHELDKPMDSGSSVPIGDPATPPRAYSPTPSSPLTPIPDTPLPIIKERTLAPQPPSDGWGSNLMDSAIVVTNTVATSSSTQSNSRDGITAVPDATAPKSVRPQAHSRVPLPKRPPVIPKPVATGKSGPSRRPLPTAASSSKPIPATSTQLAPVGAEKGKNAFSLLMENRQPMTEKEKRMAAKTGSKAKVQQMRPKDGHASVKPSTTIKSKMKTRTKPTEKLPVPIIIPDEDEEESQSITQDRQEMQVDLKEQSVESPDPIPPEPMPTSPPTSLFSEDLRADAELEPNNEVVVQDRIEERPKIQRASSLFSLDGDISLLDASTPTALETGVELSSNQVPQSGLTLPAQDVFGTPRPMVVDDPVAIPAGVLPSPLEITAPEVNKAPDSKGKGKRAPRKKGAVNMPPRPTRTTRSASSRKHEAEAPVQPCALSINDKELGSSMTDGPAPATVEPPPSAWVRGKKAAATPPPAETESTGIEPVFQSNDPPPEEDTSPAVLSDDPFGSELSEPPSDMDEDEPEESQVAQAPAPISMEAKKPPSLTGLRRSPSPRAVQASLARAALPKTPAKSSSASPSKLPRSSSMFAPSLNATRPSRPALATAGSSYAELESALGKLNAPPPSRPSTSMGFNRDNSDDDSDAPMGSKDDTSIRRSALGIGRPSSAGSNASSASKSGLPVFKRPAPIQKDSRGIFMPASKSAVRKPGAIMRGGQSIYDRVAGGVRGQKASQRTALPTVIGSPVKGGATTTMVTDGDADFVMGEFEAGPSNQGDLTLADITMASDVESSEAEGSSKAKKKEKEDKSRRASMALHSLSQSLNDIRTAESMLPPSPPRRAGLRSTSSTYPSSSAEKNTEESSKKEAPATTLSILSDCKVFVDYRSDDPHVTETWIQMLKDLGARIMTRLGPTCTHILWKDGLPSTINRYRSLNVPKPFVVGNNWIVSCAQEGKRVDETEFLVEIEDYKFAAAGHKRRKSMIPKLRPDFTDTENNGDSAVPDGDVSMNSDISMSSDLTPLERARMRQSLRTQ